MFTQWDHALFLAMNFDGGKWLDEIFWFASGKVEWILLYICVIYIMYRRCGVKQTALALLFVVAMVVCDDQIANVFKKGFQKLRPTHEPALEGMVHTVNNYKGGLYGTVSAHAATVTSIAAFTIGLIRHRVYTAIIIFWGLLVCYSRIYLGVHYPCDIIFGMILGGAIAWAGLILYRKSIRKMEL